MLATIAAHRPAYLQDYRLQENPDAVHYVVLGRNVLLHGAFSRQEGPPFTPDLHRTPVYPLLAGGLDLAAGPWLLFLGQALLHAVACRLVFALVRPHVGVRAAAAAGLLLALDPSLVISNATAMSEVVFGFLLLAALVTLAPLVTAPGSWRRAAAGGLLMALLALTRPSGLYMLVIAAAVLLGRGIVSGQLARHARAAIIMTVVAMVPIGGWIMRNYQVFGVARLSNVDVIVSVYYLGAAGYQVRHGIDLGEAQRRISVDFGLPPVVLVNNPWLTGYSARQLDDMLRATIRPVLARHPAEVAAGAAMGVVKATVASNVPLLGGAIDRRWVAPGASSVLEGDVKGALERLTRNHPLLVVLFIGGLLHTALVLGLVALFLAMAIHSTPLRWFAAAILPFVAYNYATIAMQGLDAVQRLRTPHVALLAACAGIAAARVTSGWSRRTDRSV